MVIQTKLPAVVAPADQVASAAGVAVIEPAVTRPVTVSLALVTRVLRRAAPLAVIIPPGTSLTSINKCMSGCLGQLAHLVWALEEHSQNRLSLTPLWSAERPARRNSRPSRGSRARTSCSCCSRTPGLADTRRGRRCRRRPRARHSRPRRIRRGPRGCSTSARYSYAPRISGLSYIMASSSCYKGADM